MLLALKVDFWACMGGGLRVLVGKVYGSGLGVSRQP